MARLFPQPDANTPESLGRIIPVYLKVLSNSHKLSRVFASGYVNKTEAAVFYFFYKIKPTNCNDTSITSCKTPATRSIRARVFNQTFVNDFQRCTHLCWYFLQSTEGKCQYVGNLLNSRKSVLYITE